MILWWKWNIEMTLIYDMTDNHTLQAQRPWHNDMVTYNAKTLPWQDLHIPRADRMTLMPPLHASEIPKINKECLHSTMSLKQEDTGTNKICIFLHLSNNPVKLKRFLSYTMQAPLRLTFDPVNPKTIQLPINPQGFVFLGAVMLELLTRNYFQCVGPC